MNTRRQFSGWSPWLSSTQGFELGWTKNVDNLKNEEDPKNEDDAKNEDDPDNEEDITKHTVIVYVAFVF